MRECQLGDACRSPVCKGSRRWRVRCFSCLEKHFRQLAVTHQAPHPGNASQLTFAWYDTNGAKPTCCGACGSRFVVVTKLIPSRRHTKGN